MRKLLLLQIFISALKLSTQIEIYNDNSENGLIFSPHSKIYVEEFKKYLFYKFDVTSAQYIISWEKKVTQMCTLNNTKTFKFNTEQNFWNRFNPEPNISSDIVERIKIDFNYDRILSNNIEAFNIDDDVDSECETLFRMAQNFNTMSANLNKLARLDTSSLDEIVSFRQILHDAERIINELNRNQYSVAFNFSSNSISDFFKYTKFNYYHDSFSITLAFSIPIYKNVTLFEVFKKPFIQDNIPFLLRSDKKFAYFLAGKTIFLNDNYFLKHCYSKNGKDFCSIPLEHFPCEFKALNLEKIPKECLVRLSRKNMITRIGNDLYISPFKPIIFSVDCEFGKHMIRIDKHSKITNEMECNLNSTYFSYNPKNFTESNYDLFVLDPANEYEQLFDITTLTFWEFYLTLCYVILVIITYFTTFIMGFYKIHESVMKFKAEVTSINSESTSSLHLYATIKENI